MFGSPNLNPEGEAGGVEDFCKEGEILRNCPNMRDWNVWLCLVTGYETYGYLGLCLQQRLFARWLSSSRSHIFGRLLGTAGKDLVTTLPGNASDVGK